MVRSLIAVSLLLLTTQSIVAQEWTRFRGPNGSGIAKDIKLPTKWSDGDYEWKVKLTGTGTSSPVVWGEKIFVTSCDAKSAKLFVQCLDAKTGKETWKREFDNAAFKQHRLNSYASSTPVVDADRVYFAMANPEHTMLIALDHAGKDAWKRDFGTWVSQHGFSASPMLYEDKVIFVNSQQAMRMRPGTPPGKSRVTAVAKTDGSDIWETPLTATRACYAVPCVLKTDGKPDQLIGANTGDGFYSLNPNDGKLNWSTKVIKQRTVASTFTAGGLLFASSGSGGGGNELVAVRPEGDSAEKAYVVSKSANYVPTAIAVNGLLFLCGDKGILTCADLETGEVQFQERLSRGFSSSLVAAGNNIYAVDQQGTVFVFEAAKKYKLLGKISLGEPSTATPAIAGGRMILRSDSHLMSLKGK